MDKNQRAMGLGILLGSCLGFFSFGAIFGFGAMRDNEFLAALWMVGCMVGVGWIVRKS